MSREFSLATIGPELERVVRRHERAVVRGLRKAAHLCRTVAVQEPSVPVDTGQLKRSFVVTPIDGGAIVENIAPHAAHHEHGTRPFTPPLGALLAWGARKARGGGNGRAIGFGAWLAIQRRGIRALGFFAKASQKFPDIVQRQLERVMREVRR